MGSFFASFDNFPVPHLPQWSFDLDDGHGFQEHFYFLLPFNFLFEMNIFVAKLDFQTTSEDLQSLFEQFGTVDTAKVVFDKETGRSRGFAFVEMPNDDEANEAINNLNDTTVDGRTIVVKKAEPREGGGGGRSGGGRSGGGGFRTCFRGWVANDRSRAAVRGWPAGVGCWCWRGANPPHDAWQRPRRGCGA